MTETYYRDDFRVEVEFDRPIGTDVDFAGTLYTEETLATRRVRFGRRGGQEQGCEVSADGMRVTIPADGHQLSPGDGLLEMVYLVPAQELPDGNRKIVRRYRLDLRLTAREPSGGCGCGEGCTCTPAVVTAKVEIPWQYVHDTDVYNAVLERVNGTFAAILGTEDVKPAPAPTPSAGARAVSRPMLRRGLLNLRSARPDCVYKSFGDNSGTVETCIRLVAGEEVDLSQWIEDSAYVACVCGTKDFCETHEVIKEGYKIKVEPADYGSSKACVIIIHSGPASPYIRKGKDGKLHAVSAGEFIDPATLLPPVGLEEVKDWVKTQLKLEKNSLCTSPVNGMRIEIQRRRSRSKKPHVKKWRRWHPNVKTRGTHRRFNCALIRARYHTNSNVAGPWSYFFCSYAFEGSDPSKRFRAVCL